MRHRNKGRKLGRTSAHREAMLDNMVTSFFKHEKIQTTIFKSKELRRTAEKLITIAKRNDIHAKRLAERKIRDREILQKLFNDIGPRYSNRNGGYTRITKTDFRLGDGSQMSVIELV